MERTGKNDKAIVAIISLAITLGAIIFVLILMNGTKKETGVIVRDNRIVFTGQFGVTYDLAEVSDIQLKNDIPAIGLKVNGAGLGDIKKGEFAVEGLGNCRLFVHSRKGPFIYLIAGGKYTILNFKDAAKTSAVYEELKKALGK